MTSRTNNTDRFLRKRKAKLENKRRLPTLSIDNAWSNKNFLYYFFVNGYNCYKHLTCNCRFSHDVTKLQTTKLLILLIFYLNEV